MNSKAYFNGPIKAGGDVVMGDSISIGNISGGRGIAIGRNASANSGESKPKAQVPFAMRALTQMMEHYKSADAIVLLTEDMSDKDDDWMLWTGDDGVCFLLVPVEAWNAISRYFPVENGEAFVVDVHMPVVDNPVDVATIYFKAQNEQQTGSESVIVISISI